MFNLPSDLRTWEVTCKIKQVTISNPIRLAKIERVILSSVGKNGRERHSYTPLPEVGSTFLEGRFVVAINLACSNPGVRNSIF